mgnify:FL=1
MLDSIFSTVIKNGITPASFAACTAVSLISGLLISLCHGIRGGSSKGFAVTVALLPFAVQTVIMLVNGNLGTGVAVAGAFSLVRFRSSPGTAKEILNIFTALAAGLAAGVGYIGVALIFVLIVCAAEALYTLTGFGEKQITERELKITVPEDLNYTEIFDDLFKKYTAFYQLKKVKTAGLGSLYQLTYSVRLKEPALEKEFIDGVRCRNGNLEIVCNYSAAANEEL